MSPEAGSVVIREVLRSSIDPGNFLFEVGNVGVYGSHLHQWTVDHSRPVNYPVVLGHEFGGRLVEVGKEVEEWQEGDRVASKTAAIISPDNSMTRRGFYKLHRTPMRWLSFRCAGVIPNI